MINRRIPAKHGMQIHSTLDSRDWELEVVIKRIRLPVNSSWTLATRGALPLSYPWKVHSAHLSHTRSHFKDAALRNQDDVATLSCVHDRTSLRPPYKLTRFWQVGAVVLSLLLTKTSLVYKFPCLLKLLSNKKIK